MQVQYYTLEQVSERGYRLLPEKRYLVVNTLVRLGGPVVCGATRAGFAQISSGGKGAVTTPSMILYP